MTTLRVHSPRAIVHALPQVGTVQVMAEIAVVLTNFLILSALLARPLGSILGVEIPDPLLIALVTIALTSVIGLLSYTIKIVVELAVQVKDIIKRLDDHELRIRDNERDRIRDPASRTRRSDIPRR